MSIVQEVPRRRKTAPQVTLLEARHQLQPMPDYMDSQVYSEAVARFEENVERMIRSSQKSW